MLELVAATTIISIALVPALKLTRSSVLNIATLERAELTVSFAVSKLEEEMASTAVSWNLSSQSGDFADVGQPTIRFMVNKSDEASSGGEPNRLAVIEVTVWVDSDSGGDLDINEQQTKMSTKLAKVLSYEYEATVH